MKENMPGKKQTKWKVEIGETKNDMLMLMR